MISILFEDDDLLAVNKPEGIAAIPERLGRNESLFEMLSAERGEKLYIVHRLDNETSGVIVFARNAETHRRLNRQFESRTIRKQYLALVHGLIADDEGTIDAPLRQFGSGRVAVDPERGKASATEFRVQKRFKSATLLETYPRTGRRHQIRVHLYHLGHPIVGDPLYGDKAQQTSYPRLMLHAQTLTLHLPSHNNLILESPIPQSFQTVLDTIATA
ncbi:MAG: RluA family pseudouridine synthase [Sedimentisphaerales bacterium]|nr:RluA family pseudouridine synthase [Sedimentisphaerales bacterium]